MEERGMTKNGRDYIGQPWIGVDLDGCLAEYHGWQGHDHIGPPIPKMVQRVKEALQGGKTIKIFTARVGLIWNNDTDSYEEPSYVPAARYRIFEWCLEHIGEVLPVTCIKDYGMVELWDDRCIHVQVNTGEVIG